MCLSSDCEVHGATIKIIFSKSTFNAPDDGHSTVRTVHTTYTAALKTTTFNAPDDGHGTVRTVHTTYTAALMTTTFNAPDDGRMYPKHVELRIQQ